MAIKPFETQDGIKIATGDSIVNDQGESVLNQSLKTTDSVAFSGVESPYFAFDGGIEITAGLSQETASTWMFNEDGSISFPDGTTQTTAYVGGTTAFYVAVNNDGRSFTSLDGLTWTEYTTGIPAIGRVAVGPNKIVYAGEAVDASNGTNMALWYALTSAPDIVTEVTGFEDYSFSEVKYFANVEKFIAVGQTGPNLPVILYSSNGVDWTVVELDPIWLATLNGGTGYTNNANFQDIETNGSGFLLLTSDNNLGAFYTTDITDTIGSTEWIDFSGLGLNEPFSKITYVTSGSFTGWHIMQTSGNESDAWYYNSNIDPRSGTFNLFAVSDIGSVFAEIVNYEPDASEIVCGNYNGLTTIMIATTDGQIQYWPAIDDGPFVSIPKPYTATDFSITQANPAVITFGNYSANTNEKVVLSNCTPSDYNGTYYVDNNNILYTDANVSIAFDSSGLGAFTSGTITFSHGQYIDALHYSGGNFYVGNDDEEMFVSVNGGATWILTQSFTGNPGEPEYMDDIDSYVTEGGNSLGNFTFSNNSITNTNGMLLLTSRGTLALGTDMEVPGQPTHFHIAFEGSNTDPVWNDLFLGDDYNYVKLPGTYNSDLGVEIGAHNRSGGNQYTWTFDTDGILHFPGMYEYTISETMGGIDLRSEYGIYLTANTANVGQEKYFVVENDGKVRLSGATYSDPATPTAGSYPVGEATAITVTNGPNINWYSTGIVANGINFTFTVDVSGNATVIINDGGTGHYVDETFTVLGSSIAGLSSPADDINFEVTAVNTASLTALDLTKQTQILTATVSTGSYSLADGTEGQIMYFVPNSTIDGAVYITIANARIYDGVSGYTDVQNYPWVPFGGETLAPTTIAIAIFADGAWCLRGGVTD